MSDDHLVETHLLLQRLRARLAIVEPVYSAAIAAHRNGASTSPGQHERIARLERAVDTAIDAIDAGADLTEENIERVPSLGGYTREEWHDLLVHVRANDAKACRMDPDHPTLCATHGVTTFGPGRGFMCRIGLGSARLP